MNDMSSMNRERKKKELKRQVISTGGGNAAVKEEAASREERPVKRRGAGFSGSFCCWRSPAAWGTGLIFT